MIKRLMMLSDQEFRLTVMVVGAVLLVPLIGLALTPEIKARVAVAGQLQQYAVSESQVTEQRETFQRVDAETKRLSSLLQQHPSQMTRDLVDATVMREVARLSEVSGLVLGGIRPLEDVVQGDVETLMFDVSLRGDYLKLRAWLAAVGDVLPGVVVKKCDMRSLDSLEEGVVIAELSLAIYRSLQ